MQHTILVVEDSPLQSHLLTRILEKRGYHVMQANGAQAALGLLQDQVPSLVVSDVHMPEMDGYELCHRIKTDPRLHQVPVILLTVLSDPVDIIRGLDAGADNYVPKPYDEAHLMQRIDALLQSTGSDPSPETAEALHVSIGGKTHAVTSGRQQILNLLIGTFEEAVRQKAELVKVNEQLSRVQDELVRRNAELQRMVDLRNEMMGVAAHDLRSPLAVIIQAGSHMLEEATNLDPEQTMFLGAICRQARFLLGLVEDLLDVTTFEAGKVHLQLGEVDLATLIRENLELNGPLAEAKKIRLEDAPPPQPVVLTLDPNKMEQVLNNLISNAIKYSPPYSTVEISLQPGPEAVLLVVDHGPGIPLNEQDRLFKPFGRTSVRASGGEKSTGLGLAIARRIVEVHGGRIWVTSDKGKGCTFSVSLPTAAAREKTATADRAAEVQP